MSKAYGIMESNYYAWNSKRLIFFILKCTTPASVLACACSEKVTLVGFGSEMQLNQLSGNAESITRV